MTTKAPASGWSARARSGAGAAVVAVALAWLSGCADSGSTPTPTPTSATSRASESPAPTADVIKVAVYYAVSSGTDLRLAREIRPLPDVGGAALTAARAVLAGEPLDPDYHGLWNPRGEVLGVRAADGVVQVDLSSSAATSTTGSMGAVLAVQALVYAVTDALGAAGSKAPPVQILIEGEVVDQLFGVVDTREPIARADPLDVRQLVQIDDPNEGDRVSRTVTVAGEAAVFEATMPWRVTTPGGAEVQAGVARTAEGQTFSPFSFAVTLKPGKYLVAVTEDDPSGGEGGPVATDTRAIVVA